MNARTHAVHNGLRRGWLEYKHSLASGQDQIFYLFVAALVFALLFINRNETVGDTGLLYPTVALPGMLAGLLAFNAITGPATALAMGKEDGSVLRAKSVPNGVIGHLVGQAFVYSAIAISSVAVILIPSAFLFDGLLPEGPTGWLTVAWVTILGLTATLPVGFIIGSLASTVSKVSTWGILPVLGILTISGIFVPIQNLWVGFQVLAQLFPVYWMCLGMRSAFLPETAAAIEIGASWRPLETVLVLGIWSLVGAYIAPLLLRRMARRQSGSQVEAAREAAHQVIK